MLRGTDRAVPKRWRTRGGGAPPARGDEGVTLIELLVAVAVIIIVLIPTAIFVIQSQQSVAAEHLRAEAINVATRQLETLQLEAAQGSLPTGTSTITYHVAEAGSRITKFRVKTSWTVITQGLNQSICASNADVAQQIWFVTAVVTWPKMDGAQPVVQTTEIAPAQAGAVQQFAGEVAVRLTYDGTDAFLADPVTATITAAWQGSGSGPVHRLSEHRRVQRHKWLVRLHDLVRRQHRAATSRRRRRAGGFQPGRCPHGNHPEGASGPRRPVRGQRGDRHRHSAHHRLLHRGGQLHDSFGGAVAAPADQRCPGLGIQYPAGRVCHERVHMERDRHGSDNFSSAVPMVGCDVGLDRRPDLQCLSGLLSRQRDRRQPDGLSAGLPPPPHSLRITYRPDCHGGL